MITSYPFPLGHADPAKRGGPPATPRPPPPVSGAWRYECQVRSRGRLILALLISAAFHAGFLGGFGPARKKPAPAKAEEVLMVSLVMPQVQELEEPELSPLNDSDEPLDLGVLVPMQQDLPQLVHATDFVQQMNFASLIEPPDFSQAKIIALPEHIRTAGKMAEKFGKIFDLSSLDRIPEAVLQSPPIYPIALRREGIQATVHVEFIVDNEGRVRNPIVIESTDSRFHDAALFGVAKWKFRPGIKAGRKVNTRMRVPIIFHVSGDE